MKWPLAIVIAMTILTMVSFPGCYDSSRTAAAHRHYSNAPSELARKQLRDAKLADWKDIAIYEGVFAVFLALCFVGYLRVERIPDNHES
jgi:hypothetical protein